MVASRLQSVEGCDMPQSIFERYGGFAKVSRIVSSFYDKMLDSPVTNVYFAKVDMSRLIDHQTKFIAYVMGGPASFTNDHLDRVHAHLGISGQAFDHSMTLLLETLEEYGFLSEDISVVRDALTSRRHLIVTRE